MTIDDREFGRSDLSTKALNCLHCENIYTIGELKERTKHELLSFYCLGKVTLDEIEKYLKKNGTTLRRDFGSIAIKERGWCLSYEYRRNEGEWMQTELEFKSQKEVSNYFNELKKTTSKSADKWEIANMVLTNTKY